MNTKRQMIGLWDEQAAAHFLFGQGYEILTRDVRTPRGEIDLVVRSGEVTTPPASSGGYGAIFCKFAHPEETINHRKQSHILTALGTFQSHDIDHWQIDTIAIEGKPDSNPLITHFENVMG